MAYNTIALHELGVECSAHVHAVVDVVVDHLDEALLLLCGAVGLLHVVGFAAVALTLVAGHSARNLSPVGHFKFNYVVGLSRRSKARLLRPVNPLDEGVVQGTNLAEQIAAESNR